MIYEIIDEHGKAVNRIVAEKEFVEKYYPGQYKEVLPVVVETPSEPTQTEKAIALLKSINLEELKKSDQGTVLLALLTKEGLV